MLDPKYLTMLHWVILTTTKLYVYLLWSEYKVFCFCLWRMGNDKGCVLIVSELHNGSGYDLIIMEMLVVFKDGESITQELLE